MGLQKNSVLSIWLFELKWEWQKKNKDTTKANRKEMDAEKADQERRRKYNETIKLEQQLN